MNLLALETSLPHASLCLACDGEVVLSAAWIAARNHDAELFPALRRALDALGERPLDYILVGSGPGSYGGVRVALAAAAGIALVTGARVVAVPSWAQLAEGDACVLSDAKRGGWTLYRPDGSISVVSLEELKGLMAEGLTVYSVERADTLSGYGIHADKTDLVPTAEGLVHSWLHLTDAEQQELAAKPAEPIYVRPPHITEAKHKPWEIRS